MDLYGTNHDPRVWDDPETFQPERFRGWTGNAYGFVPQGGGSYESGHRCPGEWITIELLKEAVALLAGQMRYTLPKQRLTVDLRRMPTLPKSRLRLRQVRAVG